MSLTFCFCQGNCKNLKNHDLTILKSRKYVLSKDQEIFKCSTSYGNPSCSSISKYSSRCPCLKIGKNCSSNCKCTNCANSKAPMKKPVTWCRCGEATKGGTTSCVDVQGKRDTKCKCFRSKNLCGKLCFCKGCKNQYGARHCITKSEATTSSRKSQTIPMWYVLRIMCCIVNKR